MFRSGNSNFELEALPNPPSSNSSASLNSVARGCFHRNRASPYFDIALTAKVLIESGKQEYNDVRPNDSLRYPGFAHVAVEPLSVGGTPASR